ncbi:multi-sensor signal transduction histidine kinase [Fibrella aestuarina BUZ 2]|uniref:histidine kinase n=1 Tax=Fibrella aestuarina BUZ 2 TaxID=1166018 RepID=I0KD96_9BACT|nr:ATP-binding protein [Fibrella aestuarina]CCH02099.1 multi-sensor signal transduction histidine kinase [Fibrella aestuarina BUZ 2]
MPVSTTFLPCGVLVLTHDLHIESVNPYVSNLLGYDADELPGRRLDTLLTMPSRVYLQTHIYPQVNLNGQVSELYLTLQTRQRTQVPVLLNALRRAEADQVCYVFTFMPVFQRRQYEQELLAAKKAAEDELLRNERLLEAQQALQQQQVELDRQVSQLRQRNDELEQFGKIISHDLQEPLRKISVFTDLLRKESADHLPAMAQTALKTLERASRRLRSLIHELQLYFTLTNEIANLAPIDLSALMASVCAEYANAPATFAVKPLPSVWGNEVEITTLFRHLIDNAVKFRQPNVPLLVRVSGSVVGHNSFRSLPNKYNYVNFARIVVSDNGVGFDNNQREGVFQLLKKLQANTPGIGLGLAMARKIAERHGGQITAESTVGEGTKVTVLLPIA